MRQRIGVSTLGIIGGLLVLLMVAAAACDDPEPTATPTTAPTATATAPPTITPTPEPSPTPTPLSVEAVVEATAASMRALESAHIEGHITMTARVTGEEEGTVEMSMVGDYQAPDRTRLSVSLTIEENDFEADYTSIANETYIQVPGADIWQVSESSDGLDLRETLRFDPKGMENLALIGEEELGGEKVYHLRGFLAGDAGGLVNSVPGGLVGMTPLGGVVVEVEFWIGVGDFLVRRTIQNIDIELSSDISEGGELRLELDMRLSDYGGPVDIQAPDVESTLGTGPGYSEETPIPAPTATPTPTAKPPARVTISRLETVKARGRLLCGGRNDRPGFGFLDADGRNVGFDIDLCRAVAAAIFADPDKLEVTTVRAPQRGPIIQSGEVDVLTANTAWTTFRDVYWGNYTITMFYDGQGFMVRKDDGFNSVFDLDGAAICVLSGTTTELNLHSFFGKHGLKLDVLTYEDFVAMSTAYEQGWCDAVTTDKSLFVVMSASTLRNPDDHTILRATISKEPSTPIVPHGDDQWLDIVKVVMSVLINPEELGVTQSNVDDMRNSDNTRIRRMLGTDGEFGQAGLGLSPTFAVDVIRAVGNYGEIYDRYMGPQAQGDAFPLPRALNRLWTDGGLIFAPPLR